MVSLALDDLRDWNDSNGAAAAPSKAHLLEHLTSSLNPSLDAETLAVLLSTSKILLRSSDPTVDALRSQAMVRAYTEIATKSCAPSLEVLAIKVLLNAFSGTTDPTIKIKFIEDSGLENFIDLMKSSTTTEKMLQVTKVFHLFCGTVPTVTEILVTGHNLLHMLISTLSYSLKQPVTSDSGNNDLLVTEIMRTLYSIAAANPMLLNDKSDESRFTMMTQLGVLLLDVLHSDHSCLTVYNRKLDVVKLLMYMPDTFTQFLVMNKCVPTLVQILSIQTDSVIVEKSYK
jgi:hypothetical protein